MREKRIVLTVLALCRILTVSTSLMAQDSGPVPVRIVLNKADKGDHIVLLTEQGDILVSKQALIKFGLESLPEKTVDFEGAPHISLREMKPDLDFKLDLETLTLHITTDASKLGRHIVDYQRTEKGPLKLDFRNSAYLNYNLTYSLNNDDRFSLLLIPTELAVRLGSALFYSTFNYKVQPREGGREEKSTRMLTNLTWDFPADKLRLVAGDIQAASGRLGSGGLFGGLQLSRNFSLAPGFVFRPLVGITGLAKTPSVVEVYLNNYLLKRENVPPGPFELRNLPNTLGRGEVVVEITDTFGRKERIVVPFYVAPGQLKPGLQEFRYSLGARREKFGLESNAYGDLALLGQHRIGLTSFFTGGFHFEKGKNRYISPADSSIEIESDVDNFALISDMTLGPLGQMSLSGARSRENPVEDKDGETRSGSAGSLNYTFIFKRFGFSFSWLVQSRDYATLSLTSRSDQTRRRRTGNVGFNLGTLGSLSATYRHTEPFEADESKTMSGAYSVSLGKNASLVLRANRSTSIDANNKVTEGKSVTAALYISFGGGHSVGINGQSQDGLHSRSATYRKSSSGERGFDFNLSANRAFTADGSKRDSQSGTLGYRGSYGVYSVTRNRRDSTEVIHDTTFSTSGAVAMVGGSVHPARPILDSFALVRLKNIPGVPVLVKNREAGKTDESGEFLVSGLSSYQKNTIAIKDSEVSMEYQLPKTFTTVTPPFRGGVLVEFRANRFQAFTGRLHYRVKGKKEPGDLSSFDVTLKDRIEETAVGRDGEFYLENIPPGTYPARIYNDKYNCRFKLHIPESDKTFVDIGEVYCETN